jgi:hypothetical protein
LQISQAELHDLAPLLDFPASSIPKSAALPISGGMSGWPARELCPQLSFVVV